MAEQVEQVELTIAYVEKKENYDSFKVFAKDSNDELYIKSFNPKKWDDGTKAFVDNDEQKEKFDKDVAKLAEVKDKKSFKAYTNNQGYWSFEEMKSFNIYNKPTGPQKNFKTVTAKFVKDSDGYGFVFGDNNIVRTTDEKETLRITKTEVIDNPDGSKSYETTVSIPKQFKAERLLRELDLTLDKTYEVDVRTDSFNGNLYWVFDKMSIMPVASTAQATESTDNPFEDAKQGEAEDDLSWLD